MNSESDSDSTFGPPPPKKPRAQSFKSNQEKSSYTRSNTSFPPSQPHATLKLSPQKRRAIIDDIPGWSKLLFNHVCFIEETPLPWPALIINPLACLPPKHPSRRSWIDQWNESGTDGRHKMTPRHLVYSYERDTFQLIIPSKLVMYDAGCQKGYNLNKPPFSQEKFARVRAMEEAQRDFQKNSKDRLRDCKLKWMSRNSTTLDLTRHSTPPSSPSNPTSRLEELIGKPLMEWTEKDIQRLANNPKRNRASRHLRSAINEALPSTVKEAWGTIAFVVLPEIVGLTEEAAPDGGMKKSSSLCFPAWLFNPFVLPRNCAVQRDWLMCLIEHFRKGNLHEMPHLVYWFGTSVASPIKDTRCHFSLVSEHDFNGGGKFDDRNFHRALDKLRESSDRIFMKAFQELNQVKDKRWFHAQRDLVSFGGKKAAKKFALVSVREFGQLVTRSISGGVEVEQTSVTESSLTTVGASLPQAVNTDADGEDSCLFVDDISTYRPMHGMSAEVMALNIWL